MLQKLDLTVANYCEMFLFFIETLQTLFIEGLNIVNNKVVYH